MSEKFHQKEQAPRGDRIVLTPEQQMAVDWLREEPDNRDKQRILSVAIGEIEAVAETAKSEAGRSAARVSCAIARMYLEAQQWSSAWERAQDALLQSEQEGDEELAAQAQSIIDDLEALPPDA